MEKSTSIKSLATALITFHVKCDKIKKDSNNPFFKSKYASLSSIQEAIREPLAESGLAYSQLPDGENGLVTILIHAETGEYLQSSYQMKPVKDDPQGRGSAITYQKRYALAAVLGLQIDEDDDANYATHGSNNPANAQSDNNDLPWLDEKPFKAMIAFLEADKSDNAKSTIRQKMTKYKIKKEYREKINALLS